MYGIIHIMQACNTVMQGYFMYREGKSCGPSHPIPFPSSKVTLACVGLSSIPRLPPPSTPYFLLSTEKNASKMPHVHKYTLKIYGISTDLTCTFHHPGAYLDHTFLYCSFITIPTFLTAFLLLWYSTTYYLLTTYYYYLLPLLPLLPSTTTTLTTTTPPSSLRLPIIY